MKHDEEMEKYEELLTQHATLMEHCGLLQTEILEKDLEIQSLKAKVDSSMTDDEYMAIQYGMDEIENLIMSGDALEEDIIEAKKHYKVLEELIEKN